MHWWDSFWDSLCYAQTVCKLVIFQIFDKSIHTTKSYRCICTVIHPRIPSVRISFLLSYKNGNRHRGFLQIPYSFYFKQVVHTKSMCIWSKNCFTFKFVPRVPRSLFRCVDHRIVQKKCESAHTEWNDMS